MSVGKQEQLNIQIWRQTFAGIPPLPLISTLTLASFLDPLSFGSHKLRCARSISVHNELPQMAALNKHSLSHSFCRSESRGGSSARESQDWNQAVDQSAPSSGGSEGEGSSKLIQVLADPAPSSCVLEVPVFLLALGPDLSWLLEGALSSWPCGLPHWPFTT